MICIEPFYFIEGGIMKKKLVMLTLTVFVAAAVLLFVGCPEDGERVSYIGTWQHIEGDSKEIVTLTQNTFEMMSYQFNAPTWVAFWGFKGAMTVADHTMTITLSHLSLPYFYGYTWYTSWNYLSNPYLYYLYYFYIYDMGGSPFDFTYEVSADGNTIYITIDMGYGPETITFTRI